jgi:hypothetical protein
MNHGRNEHAYERQQEEYPTPASAHENHAGCGRGPQNDAD